MRLLYIGDFTEQFAYRVLRGIHLYSQDSGEPWVVRRMPPSYKREHGFSGVLSWAKEWRADAVLGQFDPQDPVAQFRKNGIVAVAVDNIRLFPDIPNLTANYEKMGRMAADAFLESGFRHFAFFGYRGVIWSDGRRSGFQERLEESGLAESFDSGDRIRGENFFWNFDQPKVWKWLVSLPKPVGIMASDDTQATLLIETCNNYGIRVPYDVAIIGVDNDEVSCNLSQPAISSIDVDMERGGYQVAKMIARMVKDPTDPGEDVIMQPTMLVLRRSSNAVATTDTAVHAALEFIHDNIRHKIQVGDVLKHVPLSRRLLEQRFLSATGVSVYQYIMRKRIQYFADLLLSTDESIANLAAQMDEPDAKTLTRRFQAILKCTPSEYRTAHLRKLR